MKSSGNWKALFIVVALFLLVASLNVIVGRLAPVRFDTTEGDVFTLSEGTRAVLAKARDSGRPVTIRFYVSEDNPALGKEQREYAKRVADLLDEYRKASGNHVVVQRYVPVPNSIEEDAAILDGITPRDPIMDIERTDSLDEIDFDRRTGARDRYFFGLSVSSLQNIETIPYLDPGRETGLEYQITRAIASVIRPDKLRIGLLEGNEIMMGGQPPMMGGPSAPPWTIYRYLEKDYEMVSVPFDVKPMEPGDEDHPLADLDLLMIVHPVRINRPRSPQPGMPPMGTTTLEELSPESQYAIDQYLLRGGRILAFLDNQYMVQRFLDPYSTVLPFEQRDENPQWLKELFDLFESERLSRYSSGLDELHESWGVRLNSNNSDPVLVDPLFSRAVSYPRPINALLQREFRLVNQLRSIPDQRWTQSVVEAMRNGTAIMADFSGPTLTDDHPVTRNLSSVRMVDPGLIEGKPAPGISMQVLVRSSPKAKALPAEYVGLVLGRSRTLEEAMARLQGTQAETGRYPVAVLLEGTFKSAFEGDPSKAAEEEEDGEDPERGEAPPPAPPPPTQDSDAEEASPPPPPPPPPAPASESDGKEEAEKSDETALPATGDPNAPDATATATSPANEEDAGAGAPTAPAEDAPGPGDTVPAPQDAPGDAPIPPADAPTPSDSEPQAGMIGSSFLVAATAEQPETEDASEPVAEPADPTLGEAGAAAIAETNDATASESAKETATATEANRGTATATAGDEEEDEEDDHHLAEGEAPGSVALVSDVDMLYDFFMGDPNSEFGRRDHDNLAFVLNLIESLAGNENLMDIRGRGDTSRPFKVIDDIRAKAAAKQAVRRKEIREKMEEINQELMDVQLVLTQEGELQVQMDAERAAKIQRLERERRELQQEQRLVNRAERQEIQSAISTYKWTNMLLAPTLVVVAGFMVGIIRKSKTAAK